MLHISNMIMLGAAGRNAGKTEMACRLIEKFSLSYKVIALKVTIHEETAGKRPVRREDREADDWSDQGYRLVEEKGGNPGKDTGRMRAAGAHKVYWLEGEREFLPEGMKAFLALINNGPDKIIICESNSMRLTARPGLFLVNQNIRDQSMKPSCREVIRFADRIIRFDSDKFAFDIAARDINYKEGRWSIRENATAIILAGGKSSRMGRDKSLLPAAGVTLIGKIAAQLQDHFQEIIIGANNKEKYLFLNLPVVPDLEEGKGPLMAIYSTLLRSQHEINFVVACDIPDLNMKYVREMMHQMKDHEIVIPTGSDGKYEPLFAVYKKSVTGAVKKLLDAGERKVSLLFKSADVLYLPLPDEGKWYRNLNTREDYQNYIKDTSL